MYWTRAEIPVHPGKAGEFKRVFDEYWRRMTTMGWHLYGAWESVVGRRPFIVDVWGFENQESFTAATAQFIQDPQYRGFFSQILPTMVQEDFKHIEPMAYCPEFRTLKTRAILYWTLQSRRDSFAEWAKLRSSFIPMAEERGWVLSAAWSLALGSGDLSECTEVWYFEDQSQVLPLLARVEQDKDVQRVLAPAETLLIKDARQLMRPIWYSPDYLA